jgi:diguanylate cyclase (GGDEF)-like protein
VKFYRLTLRLATAIGLVSALGGVAGIVYCYGVGSFTWYLGSGAGALVASGLTAAVCALLLDSAEVELLRLRHERDITVAERDVLRDRLHGLERRAESLTLVREIHRSTNIVARGERLRQILSVIGQLGDRVEATLFASVESLHGATDLLPSAHLKTDETGEVFLRMDRHASTDAPLTVAEAAVAATGSRWYFAGDLHSEAERVGRIEATLNEEVKRKPAETLSMLLESADLDRTAAADALEHGQVLRYQEPSLDYCELLYPLAAEGKPVGVLRVRLPDRCPTAGGADAGISDLEEVLSECARHVALALKKEKDVDRAEIDGLTGLLMKREFEPRLEEAIGNANEQKKPVALLVIDIDHFKSVNDTHGHRTGDIILRGVAALLRRHVRACDAAFRYGGEEMCVLLPGSGTKQAKVTAERLRSAVESAEYTGDAGQTVKVTISLGLVAYDPKKPRAADKNLDPGELFRRADAAVYVAKDSGRNQVVCWTSRMKKSKPKAKTGSAKSAGGKSKKGSGPKRSMRKARSRGATQLELPIIADQSSRLRKSA